MLTPFAQNWRTSQLPFSLALQNTVNTGGSYTTPSRATENSKIWASAGFRGYGPVMSYPGAGMDGIGCGCEGGGASNLLLWALAGFGVWCLLSKYSRGHD
jgi:hypothetical protein